MVDRDDSSPRPPEDESPPPGPVYPELPDPRRIQEIRRQLDGDLARRRAERAREGRRFGGQKRGKQVMDIGTYTLIPMLLLAGPAVGYGLGWLAEHWWGGSPWGVVAGVLFGLAAAFRQVYLILAGKAAPLPSRDDEHPPEDRPGSPS
ncbi:MAG: AtpZ/AtpI family protein [bacterium]